MSGVSRGPKSSPWVLGKSNSLGPPSGKSNRLRNSRSLDVLKWAIVEIGCFIFEMVSIIRL